MNHFKIAFRHLRKRRIYSFINIMGLAIGLCAFILISLFIRYELSYDRYHQHSENIYRLYTDLDIPNGDVDRYAPCVGGAGAQITQDFPEVESAVRLIPREDLLIEKDQQRLYDQIVFSDPSIFEVFSYKSLNGKLDTQTLADPYSLVLTRSAAQKYFGSIQVLGQTLRVSDSLDFKVMAVIEDIPANSHFHFTMLSSTPTLKRWDNGLDSWWNFGVYTYLRLKEGVDTKAFAKKIEFYSRKFIADQEDGSGYAHHLGLQKLSDIHLKSTRRSEWEANSKMEYLYIFGIIGLFILGIGAINYMNLATALSAHRAKEVGVRKVVGSNQRQLIGQFLAEAILISTVALLIALLLTEVLLPFFNQVIDKKLYIPYSEEPGFIAILLTLSVFLGLLAGVYPAFFLSRFKPLETLKGNFFKSPGGAGLRKALVIFQFVITVTLIIATLVVNNQLQFMRSKNLGFDKEEILVLATKNDPLVLQKLEVLKEKLSLSPLVSQVSSSSGVPGRSQRNRVVFKEEKGSNQDQSVGNDAWNDIRFIVGDFNFSELYGLKILEGRGFNADLSTDKDGVFLLNQAALEKLGFANAQAALESEIGFNTNDKRKIIGVVEDFHFKSLQTQIEPLIIYSGEMRGDKKYLSFQFQKSKVKSVLAHLEKNWAEVIPGRPLDYFFLDADFDKQYRGEEKLSSLFQVFAFVAILVAVLGLLGLSAFTANQKMKEIGIRKVLGASILQILGLLTGQFTKLVLWASLIAFPIAYWAMSLWLEDFAYRVSIPWFIFPLAALLAIFLSLLTVSYHAWQAARVNPAKVLKDE